MTKPITRQDAEKLYDLYDKLECYQSTIDQLDRILSRIQSPDEKNRPILTSCPFRFTDEAGFRHDFDVAKEEGYGDLSKDAAIGIARIFHAEFEKLKQRTAEEIRKLGGEA